MINVLENRSISIMFLTSSYPSSSDPTSKSFMTGFTGALSQKKIRVYVICPHQPGLPFREIDNEIIIIRFPYWFNTSGEQLGGGGGIVSSLSKSWIAIIQIIPFCICQFVIAMKIIKNEKIDLIHSHWIIPQGFIGGIICFFTDIPHISTIHGTDIYLAHSSRLLYPIVKFVSCFSNCITANSSHTYKLLHEIVPLRKRLIKTIPMGIRIDEFKSSPIKKIKKKKTILYIGRLITWKGVQYLIEAANIVKKLNFDIQLIIIGDGPNREELIRLSDNLQMRSLICFLTKQDRLALLSYYQNADIFVLPSIKFQNQTEGLGVVLLEAMASGVPVIGSNIGGIPDIIKNNVNGLLVPPGDSKALAMAIIMILQDPDLAERLRKAGLETVKERFSWDAITEQFIDIYRNIL